MRLLLVTLGFIFSASAGAAPMSSAVEVAAKPYCARVYEPTDIDRAKYLVCFNQGAVSELDLSKEKLTAATFGSVPLKIKDCHSPKVHARTYASVTKTVRANGEFRFFFDQIDQRFSDISFRKDSFLVAMNPNSLLDAQSDIDSIGSGSCYWLDHPLGEQRPGEDCLNFLTCSSLWPEYCNCSWP